MSSFKNNYVQKNLSSISEWYTTSEIRSNVQAFMEKILKEPLAIIDRLCVRM